MTNQEAVNYHVLKKRGPSMRFYKSFGTEQGCQIVFDWKTKLLNLAQSSNSNGRDDKNFTKYGSV